MLKLIISRPGIILNIPEIGSQTRSPINTKIKSRDINTLIDRLHANNIYDFSIVSNRDNEAKINPVEITKIIKEQEISYDKITHDKLQNIEKLLNKILDNPFVVSAQESESKKPRKKIKEDKEPEFIPSIGNSDLTFSGTVEKSVNNDMSDLLENVRKIKELTKQ